GTTGGLIAGWYILKGAGKVIFAPAKSVMVARGATAETFNKLKKVSYTLVAPLLGLVAYQTISAKKNESDLARVEQNTEQLMSRIGLEAIFPEPTVQLAAEECRMAYNAIQDAPSVSLRRFWTQSAQNKCKLFESHATYALKSLEGDDYNRCHPGNRGAKERIEKLMIEISNLYNN
ncbi:MAG: hypothetical protein KDD38_09835, partial [Bdellovibrionales bacterium]|nr:hypothetical protein [Bdellovibrionales bacterium]